MEKQFDYEAEIYKLRINSDNSKGIESKLVQGVFRRKLVDDKKALYAQEDYAQQILNLCRATKEIIDIDKHPEYKERAKVYVDKFATEALKKYTEKKVTEDEAIADLQESNSTMVELLKKIGVSKSKGKINKMLRLAEAYAGLNDEPYDIETVTEIGGKTFIQRSERISTLTDEQKRYFEDRNMMQWYKGLSRIEKGLIERHLSQLTDGRHVVSCIIKNIPGVRNAYTKELVQIDKNGDEKLLNSYLHSAGIHSLNPDKESAEEIARQNYKQLNFGPNELKFITLTSELPLNINDLFEGLDKKIVSQTRLAAGENFINIPVNSSRGIAEKHYRWYLKETLEKFYKEVAEDYLIQLPKLCDYLFGEKSYTGGVSRKSALKEIEQSDFNDTEKCGLKELVELKRLSAKYSGFSERITDIYQSSMSFLSSFLPKKSQSNDSIKLASSLVMLSSQLDRSNRLLISCKSGKDRTGYTSYKADSKTLKAYNPELNIEDIQAKLTKSSHAQFLSSCCGGKTGCFGLKPVEIDGNLTSQEGLFTSAARSSSNIKLTRLSKENESSMEDAIIGIKLKVPSKEQSIRLIDANPMKFIKKQLKILKNQKTEEIELLSYKKKDTESISSSQLLKESSTQQTKRNRSRGM